MQPDTSTVNTSCSFVVLGLREDLWPGFIATAAWFSIGRDPRISLLVNYGSIFYLKQVYNGSLVKYVRTYIR